MDVAVLMKLKTMSKGSIILSLPILMIVSKVSCELWRNMQPHKEFEFEKFDDALK